jgi:hypothetical protein
MGTIIDDKYKNRYTADRKDWLSKFIDDQVVDSKMKTVTEQVAATNADGTPKLDDAGNPVMESVSKEVPSKSTSINMDRLFDLAEANGIDARKRYGDQAERKNAPGRLRMTIGNMLRAAARRRHGLNNIDGTFVEADAAFVGDTTKTENPDGSRIQAAAKTDGPNGQESGGTDGPNGQESLEEAEA